MPFKHMVLRNIDWLSCLLVGVLSLFGLLFVFSTTYQEAQPYSIFFKKQLLGIVGGYLIFIVMSVIDYRRVQRWGFFLYFGVLVALTFTLFKGSIGLGAQRWINMGLFKYQPAELVKFLFPAFFTYYLLWDNQGPAERTYTTFLPLLITLSMSLFLILKQPDLGTAIIIGIVSLILLAYAGIGKKFFIIGGGIALISTPLLWHLLKPYQKQRIAVFLGYGDRQKERYQIEQSCIAIGSGGLQGKGFLRGTQNMLQFLPESRTDFIFSIICEELGFMGACAVIIVYIILFVHILSMISTFHDETTQIFALGLIAPLCISAIINMGMVTGLLPVVGIPLPFMSFGSSHTWIEFASLGCFNSIALRRSYHNTR
jgi:rod shape determining protein RodA